MMQPDIAVKSTISCSRFLTLYFSLLLNITRRTINAALSFCHKREEDTFSCGLLMFSRPQGILMEQVSLCIHYMLIAVSCLHCPDAVYQHDFSVNHICEQHIRIIIYLRSLVSPLLFAVERPLPFINCFWSVLVLTDPDQLGVTGFV